MVVLLIDTNPIIQVNYKKVKIHYLVILFKPIDLNNVFTSFTLHQGTKFTLILYRNNHTNAKTSK